MDATDLFPHPPLLLIFSKYPTCNRGTPCISKMYSFGKLLSSRVGGIREFRFQEQLFSSEWVKGRDE